MEVAVARRAGGVSLSDEEKREDEELKPVLLKIQDMCDLKLTERDNVQEALVLHMIALQGFASMSRQVKQRLAVRGSPISMDMLFTALKEVRGWTRAASLRFIKRGRELYCLANLRPEQVLSIHLYTGPMLMHYNAVLRRFPGVLESMNGNRCVTTVLYINLGTVCHFDQTAQF